MRSHNFILDRAYWGAVNQAISRHNFVGEPTIHVGDAPSGDVSVFIDADTTADVERFEALVNGNDLDFVVQMFGTSKYGDQFDDIIGCFDNYAEAAALKERAESALLFKTRDGVYRRDESGEYFLADGDLNCGWSLWWAIEGVERNAPCISIG